MILEVLSRLIYGFNLLCYFRKYNSLMGHNKSKQWNTKILAACKYEDAFLQFLVLKIVLEIRRLRVRKCDVKEKGRLVARAFNIVT